ncbi:MAG TPA: DUF4236 domain-containing protein [Anaerolineaceae bacterium]|nr:DUF4236 domain-containing protein [Anaerolineaceae bacterium]
MGFRLRRSLKIAPGVRLNISKKGIGTSVGVKGMHISSGPSGSRMTTSIPGTGLSQVTQIGKRSKRSAGQKSKTAALLWCIFLGYFGGHYFYVDRIGKGLLYFFTVGLFGIGWLVDIFVILSGSFRDAAGNQLRF